MNVPEPTTAKLVDKKTAAYEKQQAEVEEESRMKSLEQLAGTLMNNGKSSDTGEKEKDGDRLQQSVNTAVGSSYQMGTNTIAACISENQIIEQGGRVKLRLLQPLQAGNITVPENSLVTGAAVIQGERLDILISSIEYAGNIIPVQLATYDIDGQKGIFVPGSETRNAAKDAAGTVSESMGNSVSFARSAGQQVVMDLTRGVMQGGTRLIAGRVRAVKVTLKAGYKVLLVTKRQ